MALAPREQLELAFTIAMICVVVVVAAAVTTLRPARVAARASGGEDRYAVGRRATGLTSDARTGKLPCAGSIPTMPERRGGLPR